jgi:hypothetical protein
MIVKLIDMLDQAAAKVDIDQLHTGTDAQDRQFHFDSQL